MNKQPSLELAIGQPVSIMVKGEEQTGFIKERLENGSYMVAWDDGFLDTREHVSDLNLSDD